MFEKNIKKLVHPSLTFSLTDKVEIFIKNTQLEGKFFVMSFMLNFLVFNKKFRRFYFVL